MSTLSIDFDQLQALVVYCMDFAKRMLEAHGEFLPFGAVINAAGVLTAVGGYTDVENEIETPMEIYQFLQGAMKTQFLQGEILAGAIGVNVDMPAQSDIPFSDGIRVQVECPGFSRLIDLPYRISSSGIEYDALVFTDVPSVICAED